MKLFSFIKDLITKSLVSKILTVIILCGIAASIVIPVAIKNNASDTVVAEVKEEQDNKSFTSEISIPISELETTTAAETEAPIDNGSYSNEYAGNNEYVDDNNGSSYKEESFEEWWARQEKVDIGQFLVEHSPRGEKYFYMMSGYEIQAAGWDSNGTLHPELNPDMAGWEELFEPELVILSDGTTALDENGNPRYCSRFERRNMQNYTEIDRIAPWGKQLRSDLVFWYDTETGTVHCNACDKYWAYEC